MKKIVRLKESDLINIVRRVIKEENANPPIYDYLFTRGDGYNEKTRTNKLYFVSNGDGFDVWAEQKSDTDPVGVAENTNMKLPKQSELGLVYNESSGRFKSNDSAKVGNSIAQLITPTMEQGNWVFFVNDKGVPTKSRLVLSGTMPVKGILDRKGTEVKLEDNAELTLPNYVVTSKPSRKDEYGKGVTISLEDSEYATKKA